MTAKDTFIIIVGFAFALFIVLLKWFTFQEVAGIMVGICVLAFGLLHLPKKDAVQPVKKKKHKKAKHQTGQGQPQQPQPQRREIIEYNGKRYIEQV